MQTFLVPDTVTPKGQTPDVLLGELARSGLAARLERRTTTSGMPDGEVYRRQLQRELKFISDVDASTYVLTVWDMVRIARKRGAFVGPGWGSSPSSLLAYSIGVTQVDPLANGLVAERFFHKGLPTGLSFVIPADRTQLGTMAANLFVRLGQEHVGWCPGVEEAEEPLRCAAFMSNRPMAEVVAVERMTEDWVHEIEVEYAPALAAGIPRIELVSLPEISRLETALERLNKGRSGEIRLSLQDLPLDDHLALSLLGSGYEEGLDLLGPEGAAVLQRLNSVAFDDIVAAVALDRPVAFVPGLADQYVARRNGEGPSEPLHPACASLVGDTCGLLLYQEQLMRIAMEVAGHTGSQADELRRALGKRVAEDMEAQRQLFVLGAIARSGLSRPEAEDVYCALERAAGTAFNKSHAVAIGLLIYWCAYVAANHPEEWEAVLRDEVRARKRQAAIIELLQTCDADAPDAGLWFAEATRRLDAGWPQDRIDELRHGVLDVPCQDSGRAE